MPPEQSGPDSLVFIDPENGFEIRPWPESRDEEIAPILADATGEGTTDAALARISSARAEATDRVFAGIMHGEVVGAYTLKRDGMANQIDIIAVARDHRRRGIGRSLLKDALRRSGRRPLVAETDEEGLPFYKACGFKMVGRRKQPDGAFRYRIGWHAPGRSFKGGTSGALNQDAIKGDC